ncbi:hypothetical protein TERTU_4093 [Teredinibacter turnerae T7901]|uniref:Uncharacterized protein n=1 Tax=Teredinibacter turnerae (strain ATCC 39867 / T7901) TaxID=377629 RepID=C5BUE8_TERTT|nr:hypothetical protein TERTU_4093 [Teredinibacter turnerae T7901]
MFIVLILLLFYSRISGLRPEQAVEEKKRANPLTQPYY